MPIIFPGNRCIDACTSTLQGKLMQSEDQGAGFNPFAKPSHHDRICIYIYIYIHVLWYSRKGNKTKQQPNIILSAIRFLICTITSSACPFPIFKSWCGGIVNHFYHNMIKMGEVFLKVPAKMSMAIQRKPPSTDFPDGTSDSPKILQASSAAKRSHELLMSKQLRASTEQRYLVALGKDMFWKGPRKVSCKSGIVRHF